MIPDPPFGPISPPRRILVRGVNWLGDAVMTTPALQRLREAHPQAHVTLLTPANLADLWRLHPSLDAVVSFAPRANPWAVAGGLRPGRFDAALVLPNSPRSALEVWLARIPHRIGYARPWRNWFLTRAIPPRPERVEMRKRTPREIRQLVAASPGAPSTANRQSPIANPQAHQSHEYLHLVAALGANPEPVPPFICVTAAEVESARRKFRFETDRLWLGLVPGAEYGPAKRWPKENFIAAATALQRRTGCGVVLFGGPADAPLAAEIESALRPPPSAVRNLAGRTTLRELCAALQVCDAALSNDTGPMHLAAAVGTPVVVPFGSTAPELTGPGVPGDPRHRLLKSDAACSPCFRRECPIDFRCMTGIAVGRVVEAVLAVLPESR